MKHRLFGRPTIEPPGSSGSARRDGAMAVTPKLVDEAFQRFDADGDGVLDCQEYADMIAAFEAAWPDSDPVTGAACRTQRRVLELGVPFRCFCALKHGFLIVLHVRRSF